MFVAVCPSFLTEPMSIAGACFGSSSVSIFAAGMASRLVRGHSIPIAADQIVSACRSEEGPFAHALRPIQGHRGGRQGGGRFRRKFGRAILAVVKVELDNAVRMPDGGLG